MDHQSLLLLIFKGWLILLIAAYLVKIGCSQFSKKHTQKSFSEFNMNIRSNALMSLSLMLPILIYGSNLVAALSSKASIDSAAINITNLTLIQSGVMQLVMTGACIIAFIQAQKIGFIEALFPRPELAIPKWLFAAIPVVSIGIMLIIQGALEQSGLFIWLEQTFNAPLNQSTVEWLQTHKLPLLTLVLLIIQVCIIAPITEEIIFRGIFFKQLEKHFGLVIACVMSALFFALIHAHLIAFSPLFIFAIILNLSFYYTKNLKIPIITHMVFNSMTIIYQLNFA